MRVHVILQKSMIASADFLSVTNHSEASKAPGRKSRKQKAVFQLSLQSPQLLLEEVTGTAIILKREYERN